jgi:hypothetical protein
LESVVVKTSMENVASGNGCKLQQAAVSYMQVYNTHYCWETADGGEEAA